ncbi:Fatty acid desaturase [Mycolicibacterium mageritense DSM 44476 = CIP 104973]|uniref:fatty acid desaturase family protein n=1 Tax=Mycolicibacterium mageritense TaxID=53462 RepID=UPI0004335A06|nr:acyl-CoA desaturase [Mycolicibacterium mageritense]CDO20130.1 Fatty acid desaturase [Mycolicibacterium mageritense DSM 44476 = CIP 104973]
MSENKKYSLTPEQAEAFGAELDAIRERVIADLGERDATYIRNIIKTQRKLEVGGRALLFASISPPFWLAGTAMLGISKILDNMEIGHNVMHGQYDWMGDPAISSKAFEWDTACPADQWRHSHNYMHHTYTNIVDMDRDIGYGILRMSEDQKWSPYYLGNPVYAFLLMVFFQYGVALHELETERIRSGEISIADKKDVLRGIWAKTKRQTLKDYVAFPLLAGPFAPFVFAGNMTANLMRNVWSYMIIFCGHFPEGTQEFSIEETENESRGQWYFRQLLGSANLTGGKLFHILSGNLSFQIEHHLFPDIPAHRHAEISVEVREICERYGLPYNTGPLYKQFGTVVRKIVRLAFPWGGGSKDAAPEVAPESEPAAEPQAAAESQAGVEPQVAPEPQPGAESQAEAAETDRELVLVN